MDIPQEVSSILICPDDFSDLNFNQDFCICPKCNRIFVMKENFIELKPHGNKQKIDENNYKEYYENLLKIGKDEKIGTFGLISRSVSSGFVKETLSHIKEHIKKDMIVCDIGAGSGDYSIDLAKNCKYILHCDLDLEGIKIAQNKAKTEHLKNIIFLCCDYLKLPLKSDKLDLVYSIDILERGKKHEENLLREIFRIVKNQGLAIVDFHSKERKKVTQVENSEIVAYSKEEIVLLIKKFNFKLEKILGTGFIPQVKKWSNSQYGFLNPIAKTLSFPPARWIAFLTKNNQ